MAQATVLSVTGNAFVVAADGSTRPLQAGDVIQRGETIRTLDGARVELLMQDGQVVALAPGQELRVDESLAQTDATPTAAEAALVPGSIEQILQVLEDGGDLTEELEAAAAGAGGGAGGDGSDFVRLLRVVEGVDPLAYEFTTSALGPIDNIIGANAAPIPPVAFSLTLPLSEDALEGANPNLDVPGTLSGNLLGEVGGVIQFINVPGFGPQAVSPGGVTIFFDADGNPVGIDSPPSTPVSVEFTIFPNGNYSVSVVGPLTHPEQGEDVLNLASFSLTGVAGNGGALTIGMNLTVQDDVPEALMGEDEGPQSEGAFVDEAQPEPSIGNVQDLVNWGADGFGSVTQFVVGEARFDVPVNGSVTVFWNQAGDFIGLTSEGAAASLQIDANGSYTFDLLQNVLLGVDEEGRQINLLDTVSITAVDGDGDPITVSIELSIQDDVPEALPDTDVAVNGVATGNVITGEGTTEGLNGDGADRSGADGPATLFSVTVGGEETILAFSDEAGGWSQWVTTEAGQIRFLMDGTYEYKADVIQPVTIDAVFGQNGNVSTTAFRLGESFFTDNGLFQNTGTGVVTSGGAGGNHFGVANASQPGQNTSVPSQINYSGSLSEALAFQFTNGPVTSATVSVSNLFRNENGGEAARWHIFDADGNRIGSGIISENAEGPYANSTSMNWTSNNTGSFTVQGLGAFSVLVIEALPYSRDGFSASDNSDFYARIESFGTLPDEGQFSDRIIYTIVDGDGDRSSSTLTITGQQSLPQGEPVNAPPIAVGNDYSLAVGQLVIQGNVITDDNDGRGAASGRDWDPDTPVANLVLVAIRVGDDVFEIPAGGTTIALSHGQLQINQDGSYTYTLNGPSNAALVDRFDYQLSDGKGGASDFAPVTFDIPVSNQPPVLTVSDLLISEEALIPGGLREEGDEDDVTLAVGQAGLVDDQSPGHTYTWGLGGDMPNLTSGGVGIVWTGEGTGQLVGRVGADGPVAIVFNVDAAGKYSVELKAPVDHHAFDQADHKEGFTDFKVYLTVTDPLGLSDTQPITITIEDDIPRIDGVQNLITLNQISEVSGALNFGFGGDGPAAQGALAITRWTDVDGITETLSADGMTLTATFGDSGTVFYTLALKSDGTYTFNLVTPQPTEVIDIGRRFGAGQPVETITIPLGEDKPTVTFNGLLFDSENNPVDLPGSGGANGRDDLNPNNIGFGLGNGNIGDNTGFEATFTAPVNGMVFELVGKAGNVDAAVVFWRAFNADGRLVDSGNIPVSGLNLPGNLPQPVAINSINEFSRIEIRFDLPDSNDGVRVQNFQIIDSLLPADLALNFQVTATDADGDAASATFSVNVVASLPQPESVALPSLAFAAQVGDSSFQTVVINKDTVSSNDQGFVVRAFGLNDKDVPTAAISIRTNSTNSGFGVNEQASGDRVEIGELDGQAQRLEVQFDNPVASAKVQLAWLRGGASPETALVLLFAGASQVGAITLTGLTDTVDNFGSLQANGGALFDRMVFTVPTDNTYAGDDYLIHSIEFTRATQFPVDITVTPSANYAASAVVEVVVEVPTGMALSSGTDNGNGTWTLKPGTDVGYTVTLNSQGSFSLSGLQLSAPGITDAQPEVAVVSASVSDDGGNLLVSGGSGNDQLSGGALNDIMMGGAGNDVLAGGAGNDILTGGEGADVFSWTLADTTADNGGFVDRITDFGNGADVLNIGDLLTPAGSSVSALVDRGNTTLTFTNSDAQVIQTIVLENYAPTDVEAMLNSLRNSGNYNA